MKLAQSQAVLKSENGQRFLAQTLTLSPRLMMVSFLSFGRQFLIIIALLYDNNIYFVYIMEAVNLPRKFCKKR